MFVSSFINMPQSRLLKASGKSLSVASTNTLRFTASSDAVDITESKIQVLCQNSFELLTRLNQTIHLGEEGKASQNQLRENWEQWQQCGDALLWNKGHKRIFEAWDISMQELSELHRDMETYIQLYFFTLMLDPVRDAMMSSGVSPASSTQHQDMCAILQAISQNMLDRKTLEKLTHKPGNYFRPDIPDNADTSRQQWRKLRSKPENRTISSIKQLKSIYL